MASTLLDALADWNAIERATDRWASMGALCVAVASAFAFLLLR